jgi:hypothetical protein
MQDPYDQYVNGFESGENPLGAEGCLFPERCMAAAFHYKGECYTPEMMEDLEAEYRIPEAVAYLISRGFTVEDFAREFAKNNHQQ